MIPVYFSDCRAPDFDLPLAASEERFQLGSLFEKADKFTILHMAAVETYQRSAGDRYWLEMLQKNDDVAVVWVYLGKGEDPAPYAKGTLFPVVHDATMVLPRLYSLNNIPSTYLIAPDGRFISVSEESFLPKSIFVHAALTWKNVGDILDSATALWEEEWRKTADLVNLADYDFFVRKRYWHYGWTDDPRCRARREVADALAEAREYLHKWNCFKGYNILVWNAYRDYFTHKKLVESFRRRIRETHTVSSDEFIEVEIQKYASATSRLYLRPGSHRQGTAVDLTLVDEKGSEFDMGTDHDELTEKAAPFYYRDLFPRFNREREIHDNRMLLREAMVAAGFKPHPRKWWHFDYTFVKTPD